MAKEFYTVKEFAKEIGFSTDRVYEWLRSGHIKHLDRITTHSIYRIPKTEVERLLGRQEVVPSQGETTSEKIGQEAQLHDKEVFEEANKQQVESEYNFNSHFNDLSKVAETLVQNIRNLTGFYNYMADNFPCTPQDLDKDGAMIGNVVDGGYIGIPLLNHSMDLLGYDPIEGDENSPQHLRSIDSLLAICLLQHFKYRFPEVYCYEDWREVSFANIKSEIVDKLMLLVHSKNFRICPMCPVCKDIQA